MAEHYYYGTTTPLDAVVVSKTSDTRTVRSCWLNGQYFALRQVVTTTVVRYQGVKESDIAELCASSETSTKNGTTRNYLGGAELRQGTNGAWMYCDACWGTIVNATANRTTPNTFEVVVTTQEMDVFSTNDNLTLTKT